MVGRKRVRGRKRRGVWEGRVKGGIIRKATDGFNNKQGNRDVQEQSPKAGRRAASKRLERKGMSVLPGKAPRASERHVGATGRKSSWGGKGSAKGTESGEPDSTARKLKLLLIQQDTRAVEESMEVRDKCRRERSVE